MPYILTPKLSSDTAQIPTYEAALRQNLHRQLLQHREQVDNFDLSGFEGEPERTVPVTFGAPRWQMEHMAEVLTGVYGEHDIEVKDDKAIAAKVIDDFIADTRQDGWTKTRRHGNTTVVFSEALADETHPANPGRELQEGYVFENDVGFGAVDGRGITFSNKTLLKESLPNLVKWMDTAKKVEADGVLQFHPVIELGEDSNAAIYPTRTLYIGGQLLSDTKDAGIIRDILLHERGHAINGDGDSSKEKTLVFQMSLAPAKYIAERLDEVKKFIQNPSQLQSADHQKDMALVRAFGDALSSTLESFPALEAAIRSYEGYDDLSPMSVAADMDNKTSLLHHLSSTAPKIDLFPIARAFNTLKENAAAHPVTYDTQDRSAAFRAVVQEIENAKELTTELTAQLQRITPEQKQALAVADKTFQHVSKAREYLADIHAAQHSEKPEELHKVFESFIELGFGKSGGRTHPDTPERIENAKYFAQRVIHRRQQEAEEGKQGQSR